MKIIFTAILISLSSVGIAGAALVAYPNDTNDLGVTLSYTLPGGGELQTSPGHLSSPGTGSDFPVPLNPAPGDPWDTNGLYDLGSGLIGGGNVSVPLYYSFIARRDAASNGSNQPSFGALQLQGGPNNLGVGNHWTAWAYSTFGVGGDQDLIQGSGGTTWLDADTNTHLFVIKIDFMAGGDDNVTVWLDPDPADGDAQGTLVRRMTATGDLSFDTINYRSGNGETGWDFDEVRFGTDFASVVPVVVRELPAFAITAIEYAPDADPNPTVTLTWTSRPETSYFAKYSPDMTNWGAVMGGGLTGSNDEIPDDGDQITVTFDLSGFEIQDAETLFFRIEEE